MSHVTCPECRLTPWAGRLLTGVHEDLERTRPDDPTWRVETCSRCGQPRTIHDDREGWSFGDEGPDTGAVRPTVLDIAPEWITPHKAAYAARVSEELILDWADTGRVERVSLPPGNDPVGVLTRTADIRAALGSTSQATEAAAAARWNRGVESETGSESPGGVNRRKFLVLLGAAITGGLLPVRALARKAFNPVADQTDPVPIRAGKVPVIGSATEKPDADRTTTGRPLVIRSVSVQPDPVDAGGVATITIDASPRRKGLSYSLTVSGGVLAQDPRSPWVWTWRDA